MKLQPWLLLLPSLVACGDKEDPEDGGGEAALTPWEDTELFGVANWDDDDGDGEADWEASSGEDDELVVLSYGPEEAGGRTGTSLLLEIDGDTDEVRVFLDGERVLDDEEFSFEVEDFEESGAELGIEFGGLLSAATLTVTLLDDAGEVLNTQNVDLLSAPLILNHHLQPVTDVMAMSYTGAGGNQAFVDGFEDVLGDRFQSFRLNNYGWDVWIQDEIEFGTLVGPDHTVDFIIDSIRTNNGSGLDKIPEEFFFHEDFAMGTWGDKRATSQDSFGNMEVSPPVTVDGVEYPFGRIYYGLYRNGGPVQELRTMLDEQQVQSPFQLDVTYLCVGHVDEFQTFVPDPTSEKGFRWIVNDVQMARDYLEGMDPETSLPKFAADHGYNTVGEILDDEELWAMNEEIQLDYVDPAIETMKAQLGLEESDIIRIPGIVEEVRGCGGDTVALIPGTANMTVVPLETGETHVFMPDPFLRSNSAVDADPFKDEIEALLPTNLEPHWLDDWDNYHIMLGEVHCGSNVIRTPISNWWETARHLIGGE